jgi:Flp pilus assembly protein TadG
MVNAALIRKKQTYPEREFQGPFGRFESIFSDGAMAMLISRFCKARGASVIPIFAISLIPVVGMVGAAVDFSRAASARAELQGALDASALMLSKEALSLTDDEISLRAQDYFNAQFVRPEAQKIKVKATFKSGRGAYSLKMTAKARVDTTFARVLGFNNMDIGSTSEVSWWEKKLEIALALDNTGSMASSSKITELQKATHNLLNTLKTAAKKPGDVKVAIIPFNTVVKVGTTYSSKPWFDWIEHTLDPATWQGCVEDRTEPNDTTDASPSVSNVPTLYPAVQCNVTSNGSLAAVMPLSYDWTALHSKVDEMTPDGTTNVTIGLMWAWHALTDSVPLTEAAPPAPNLDKIIVLMTDGENTQNRWTTTSSLIDARLKAACDNVKTTGIKLYTVRVLEGNAPLLQSCATNGSMYFDVQDATQLNTVFGLIANNVANLRISK